LWEPTREFQCFGGRGRGALGSQNSKTCPEIKNIYKKIKNKKNSGISRN
jgi:hypothetical protein